LLLTPISSPDVLARFPQLKDPNVVYPGFPASQKLNQALRPYPQWLGIPPFLGPPLGTTWYDSLQAKITKRYSHGLDMQASFTWQKEETLGVNSDTSYFTPGTVEINDVFNRASLKQLSALSKPFMLVVSFNYKTPAMNSSTLGLRVLSMALRDWTLGGVLRYQSGNILGTPESNNNLFAQLSRTDNPATFGGANTLYNRNPGVPLFLVDPNSHPDPMQKLSLNPAAWTDAAPGQFGTGAAYYNDFRWQRQPSESLSLGRIFRLGAEDKGRTLQIRAEFMNVFNRVQLPQPSSGGPFSTTPATPQANGNPGGTLSGGWGFVDTIGSRTSMTPRTGQLVMRLNF